MTNTLIDPTVYKRSEHLALSLIPVAACAGSSLAAPLTASESKKVLR
jgi:hypothetical protein